MDVRGTEGHVIESFDDLRAAVRFAVDPPVQEMAEDRGGGFYRLADEEGWIEVRFNRKERCVEIRGAHPIQLEPHSSNLVYVRLVGSTETPTR
jgi:hypothetical protein